MRTWLAFVFAVHLPLAGLGEEKSASAKTKLDVIYKTVGKSSLRLDLHYPSSPQPGAKLPLVVFTHGGGWAAGKKTIGDRGSRFQGVQALNREGFCVASVEYRLCSKNGPVTIRDCVTDAKDALRFLAKNSEKFSLDPDRVFTWGDSAGGHLAQMVLLSPPESFPGDPALAGAQYRLIAGVSWYGPSDFEKTELFNPPGKTGVRDRFGPRILGPNFDGDDDARLAAYREVSPVNYLRADSPPLLMMQGDNDTTIPVHHAQYMLERGDAVKAPVESFIVENSGHNWRKAGGEIDPTLEEIFAKTASFMKERLDRAVTAPEDSTGTASAAGSGSSKPNFVVFLTDDMGWGDSGTYGHPLIQTPNLDKLASQGVKFTQCYSASGVCSPSRSAILTGRTPYRNGVWRHLSGNHDAHLRESEITYPKLLKGIGYETCHVGKWHLNSLPQFNTPEFPQPKDHGYDHVFYTHNNASPSHENPNNFVRNGKPVGETKGYSAQLVAAEAERWLTEIRDPGKPFALSVWLHEPHSPIATDPMFQALYEGHENAKYMGNITQLDAALGQVMEALEKTGAEENTFFFFTSDNGPVARFGGTTGGLRGGKRSSHEGGIRVPGVIRWPGQVEPGTVSDVPIVGTDVFTTVLDIVGIPLPEDRTIDGVSLLPTLIGKPLERSVPLFWRTHVSQAGDRVALRVGDWKIVGNDTLTEFQLFEIQKDWKEEKDLAKAMPEKTEELKQKLLEVWAGIEAEGPKEWWLNERQKPTGSSTLNY